MRASLLFLFLWACVYLSLPLGPSLSYSPLFLADGVSRCLSLSLPVPSLPSPSLSLDVCLSFLTLSLSLSLPLSSCHTFTVTDFCRFDASLKENNIKTMEATKKCGPHPGGVSGSPDCCCCSCRADAETKIKLERIQEIKRLTTEIAAIKVCDPPGHSS